MYQTVGHEALSAYADCKELPLYRISIEGEAVTQSLDYHETVHDEVESLYQLLAAVKRDLGVEAVSCGAILSYYQRNRLENVYVRNARTPHMAHALTHTHTHTHTHTYKHNDT